MIKILSAVIIGLFLTSCGRGENMPPETNMPDVTNTPVDVAVGTDAAATPVPADNTGSEGQKLIGEEKAKEIALQKAGLSFGEVIFDRVELERDEGVLHYEVEFKKGRTEYDADINAADGRVMSFETDVDD